MSSSTYFVFDLPLAMPEAEASRRVRSVLSEMPWDPASAGYVMMIAPDLPFLLPCGTVDDLATSQTGAADISFADGRMQCEISIDNVWRVMSSRWIDGREKVIDPRLRVNALLDILDAVTDAQPGDIVGATRSEEADNLSPILMTPSGIAIHHASTSDRDQDAWHAMLRDPITAVRRIPPEAIGRPGSRASTRREVDLDLDAIRRDRIRRGHAPKSAVANGRGLG